GDKGDPGAQGIQGIQGQKGDKGDTGSKGDTGPSDAYFHKPGAAIVTGSATVATEWLPAGQYVLTAKGAGASYFPNMTFGCTLSAGADQDATGPLMVTNPSLRVPFSLLTEHSSGQGFWATLDCTGTIGIEHTNLTAIKVGQLHAW